jgi:hypothetical protein
MSKKPKEKEHVLVVVRIDKFHDPSTPVENTISVTKVFWTVEEAEAEVKRMNDLNGSKGCLYFWRTGRLQPRLDADENPPKPPRGEKGGGKA